MSNPKQPLRIRSSEEALPQIRIIGRRAAPHEDAFHFVLTLTWPRFFALVALAYLTLNALFATLYWIKPGCIAGSGNGFEQLFYFSVQTIGTIGYGTMAPSTRYGHVIVALESLVGIVSVALVTGITFSKFARPRARAARKSCG